jgi:archaellum biogenesis ATPase FlaH
MVLQSEAEMTKSWEDMSISEKLDSLSNRDTEREKIVMIIDELSADVKKLKQAVCNMMHEDAHLHVVSRNGEPQ